MVSDKIERFLRCVMKNSYSHEEDAGLIKYYNKDFDVIFQKKKDQCVVIDKRGKHILYNDINIALSILCKT